MCFFLYFYIFPAPVLCLQAYYASSSALDDDARFDAIQYDPKLGLAVEGLVDGITIEHLWRVV